MRAINIAAALRVRDISLVTIFASWLGVRGIIGLCEFKHACHVDELTDESVRISEVVDVVVLELEEGSCLRLLVNDDWKD